MLEAILIVFILQLLVNALGLWLCWKNKSPEIRQGIKDKIEAINPFTENNKVEVLEYNHPQTGADKASDDLMSKLDK